MRLASLFAAGFVSLHNVSHSDRISVHKAVACKAINTLKFYTKLFAADELLSMMLIRDSRGYSCIDYANLSDNISIKDFVNEIQYKAEYLQKIGSKELINLEKTLASKKFMTEPRER